jgi:hypothetical protein
MSRCWKKISIAVCCVAIALASYAADGKKGAEEGKEKGGTDKSADSKQLEINTAASYSRLCSLADVEGLWKVVKWTAFFELKPADWKNTVYLRHQWILLGSKGEFRIIGSNMKMDTDKVERKLHKLPVVMLLSFDRPGVGVLISKKPDIADSKWRCAVVTKNVTSKKFGVDLKKGDVIMTMLAPNGNVVYFRQMRRPRGDGK